MKLKKTAATLAAFMILSSVPASAKTLEFTIGSTDMYVSNTSVDKVVLDCKPYTSDDRTLVPVRVISENFGAEVGWDDATGEVSVTIGDTEIQLCIGSNTAYINGEPKTLDVTPELTDSRTMVPLRFISEALGKRVEYVELTEQVIISDEDYAISVDGFDISVDDIKFYAVYNGIDTTDKEQLTEALPGILSEIAENAALSSVAKKAGVSALEEDQENLRNSLYQINELIYGTGVLLAPGAKLLSNELYGSQYLKSVTMPKDTDDLEILYNQDYIRVKHILLKTFNPQTAEYYDDAKKSELKKKAEGILGEIKKSGDFDSLHAQHNEDDESFFYPDGLTVCYNELIPEFAEVAFKLKEGEISEIVETKFGYHIIKRLPLAALDETIFSEIKYSAVPSLISKKADITYHMTNEEIVSLIAG